MYDFTYSAARTVAPAVFLNLSHHIDDARRRGEPDVAQPPSEGIIGAIIDAAFWASLRREEGHAPKISLAFLAPGETHQPLVFQHPLPLDPAVLTRVAPAVERPGIHLGVQVSAAGGLSVWGMARHVPKYCCVVEVAEPGLIVVKHHRGEELAKFANVAVLEGDQIRLVDEQASSLPDCPALLTSLLGFDAPGSWAGALNVLVQLAVSMRAHRRGGLLLVVPAATTAWRESFVHPMTYEVDPLFSDLGSLVREPDASRRLAWREDLARAVDAVAGLTAVDGATVLTSDYDVLGFGAKIARRRGAAPVDQITVTEPIQGGQARILNPGQLGGTRHLSAAQFVHDQPDAIALVASQDGRFTIFAWSPFEGMVHAHRVETLLL
jgi:hypothetical protein